MFGWPLAEMYDQKAKATVDPYFGITPRQALQFMGTDVVRNVFPQIPGWKVGPNFWVERLKQDIITIESFGGDVVVSDCRFSNEVDMIHELGGLVYLVQRDAVVPPDLSQVHASERPDLLQNIDGIIPNNGTIKQLHHFLEYSGVLKLAIRDGRWVKDDGV